MASGGFPEQLSDVLRTYNIDFFLFSETIQSSTYFVCRWTCSRYERTNRCLKRLLLFDPSFRHAKRETLGRFSVIMWNNYFATTEDDRIISFQEIMFNAGSDFGTTVSNTIKGLGPQLFYSVVCTFFKQTLWFEFKFK